MATDVDQSCYEWSREELTKQGDSKISVSQMLDHGSISFGRFALEPLSWEKRSVFIHDRYQEELEKLRAPGLVAQKKAYFEEYYKSIRARKALQENQCTDPASYRCCSSHSSAEVMEENQRVVPSECHEYSVVETIGSGIGAASSGVTLDIDGETELVVPDSPIEISNDNKHGEIFPNSRQCQMLEEKINNHEPMMVSIEDSEQHDFLSLDNKKLPSEGRLDNIFDLSGEEKQRIVVKGRHDVEFESSIRSCREKTVTEVPHGIVVGTTLLETDPPAKMSEVDKRVEHSGNKHLQSWYQNSFYHKPTAASIKGSKQLDLISPEKEVILKISDKFVVNDSTCPLSSPEYLKLKLNKEGKKVNQAVKGHKSYASASGLMEYTSSAGYFIKTENKTKSRTVILNEASSYSSQKRKGQISVCFNSPNVDRVSKYASVRSHGSHDGVRSKVTTHFPFSFSTGKQGVSARADAKNKLSPLPLPPANTISKDASSVLGVSYGLQREKLESSRGHEKHGKRPFFTYKQVAHLAVGNATNGIRPLMTRSVNLPTYRGGTDVGTNSGKLVRNNEDGELKLVEMMASSTVRDLQLNSKNSPHGDRSLNRKKLRS